ncbi:uncharacterized protein BO97DRAFT_436679 [Aspergillus homomorphus CBS 101889]|uniref:Rhodopsin domain-containing protein n=1 Tax=Aspergillus homomorphus (strain CBS 101889) TaxID=1450537 RepID=A0A395HNP2_ASPHC|nr:hypothetical protein BO97DRAFT_436679 [Aspergillus homomorphus CBS 101889]RAL09572.1 hypothetical protein BO97DRAFT_436679 [Aspergillus homomorphus CBS 101889]
MAKVIITVTTILGVLAILTVILRVYVRIYSKLYLGVDDWITILALIVLCGISIIIDYIDAIATMGVIKVSLLFSTGELLAFPVPILICYVAGNSFFNLLILALLIAAVQNLQIDQSKKLFMSVIFVLGSTCMAVSLVRLYYAVQWTKETATISSIFEAPFIYNILWVLLEPLIFIVVGSILIYGPLLHNCSKKEGSTKFHEARNCPLSHFQSGKSHQHGAEKTLHPTSSSQVELLPV